MPEGAQALAPVVELGGSQRIALIIEKITDCGSVPLAGTLPRPEALSIEVVGDLLQSSTSGTQTPCRSGRPDWSDLGVIHARRVVVTQGSVQPDRGLSNRSQGRRLGIQALRRPHGGVVDDDRDTMARARRVHDCTGSRRLAQICL
jgi:hypothetical protein